jgi:hypothetical protein
VHNNCTTSTWRRALTLKNRFQRQETSRTSWLCWENQLPERILVNLLLNKLPHSYEDVYSKSIHYGCDAIFERTSTKLITKYHCMKKRGPAT